ncbi:MAG: response regulator [Eubacteriales bacterium]|nr:response regulator [Eubacteriales bacterium]
MRKVVLVDNEKNIREGIKGNVDWKALSLEVAGEAEDGQTALKVINDVEPDILITDIKMPRLDGLQLVETVRQIYPNMRIILISGHDDFKYAQRGIKLGVEDYLLKPIQIKELIGILEKINQNMDEESANMTKQILINEASIKLKPLVLEKFFRSSIYGELDKDKIFREQKQLFSGGQCFFAVAILQIDSYLKIIKDMSEEEQRTLSTSFFENVDSYFINFSDVIGISSEQCESIVFLYNQIQEKLSIRLTQICTQLKQIMLNRDMGISIAVGKTYENAAGIRDSYLQARKAMQLKFVMGANSMIHYSTVESMENAYDSNFVKACDGIISAIRFGNKQKLKCCLEKISFELLASGQQSRSYTNLLISGIFRQTIDLLEDLHVSIEEVYENPLELYSDILKYQTLQDMIGALYDVLCNIMDYMNLKKQGKFSYYVESAKQYIEKNYYLSDINLDKIAGEVQMSVSYFSLEFKRVVGKTYIEFLTDLRLKKAKELLSSTSYKISEVSEMIGYENSTYFNYLFKLNTQMTPGQYRKMMTNDF